MKRNLLVTLADSNYVEQSKQFFSSVYHNAGWEGDLMLLSYGIPESELTWFRERGIFIYACEDVPNLNRTPGRWSPVVVCKFNVFKMFFKNWDRVVYMDSDVIVRASLDALVEADGFAGVKGGHVNFRRAFFSNFQTWLEKKDLSLCSELVQKSNTKRDVFNSGIFAFPTRIITEDLFDTAIRTHDRYGSISTCAEELALNILFPDWIKLSAVYNLDPQFFLETTSLKPADIDGVVLHFIARKPWSKDSPFFDEWSYYYGKADDVTTSKVLLAKNMSVADIEIVMSKLFAYRSKDMYRKFLYYGRIGFQKYIGLVGLILKRVSPRAYEFALKIKTKVN